MVTLRGQMSQIGLFVSTLPLCYDLNSFKPFRQKCILPYGNEKQVCTFKFKVILRGQMSKTWISFMSTPQLCHLVIMQKYS